MGAYTADSCTQVVTGRTSHLGVTAELQLEDRSPHVQALVARQKCIPGTPLGLCGAQLLVAR